MQFNINFQRYRFYLICIKIFKQYFIVEKKTLFFTIPFQFLYLSRVYPEFFFVRGVYEDIKIMKNKFYVKEFHVSYN